MRGVRTIGVRVGLRRRLLLAAAVVFGLVQFAASQYYEGLQEELSAKGLPQGSWVIGGGSESEFVATRSGATQGTVVDVTGQTFTQGLRIEITTLPQNYWSANFQYRSTAAVFSGSVMLAVVQMRCVDTRDVTYRGKAQLVIKNHDTNDGLYTKSLAAGTEWKTYYIPFVVDADLAVDKLRMEFFLGFKVQTLEFGGVGLIDYGTSVSVDDLPVTTEPLTYPGREEDAAWRENARRRIEELRKGDMHITVKGSDGAAVPDARVSVRMTRHAFRFGTAICEPMITGTSADAQRYRSEFLRLFNYAVLENYLKWHVWHDAGTHETTLGVLDFLKQHDIPYRGHNILWPRSDVSPPGVQAMLQADPVDTAELRRVCNQHILDITAFVEHYPPVEWDVINETFSDLYSKLLGFEAFADWYKLAEQAVAPGTQLYINEACPTDYYFRYMDMLRSEGARIDGIGIEGHIHYADGYGPEYYLALFDTLYNRYQTAIAITEFDYRVGENADDHSPAQDALAADFTRDFLTACFSHPSMNSFLMWGFWNGRQWLKAAPIFRTDWTLRPSGQAYIDLVFGEWWTTGTLTADEAGTCTVRGFLGDYEIIADDGSTAKRVTAVLEKEGTSVTIILPAQSPIPAPVLRLERKGAREVALAWDPQTGVEGYHLYDGDSVITASPVRASPYTAGSLEPGTRYSFRLRGIDAQGVMSPFSNSVTVTTDETYYSTLMHALTTEPYSMADPEYIIGSDEEFVLSGGNIYGNGAREFIAVTGQPFTRAVRHRTDSVPAEFWQRSVIMRNARPITAGDSLLAVFWLRTNPELGGADSCDISFVVKSATHEELFSRRLTCGETWMRFEYPFSSTNAYDIDGVEFAFFTGYRIQVIEIGGIALVAQAPPTRARITRAATANPLVETAVVGGNLRIAVRDADAAACVIDIVAADGRLVQRFAPDPNTRTGFACRLPSGMYVVRVRGRHGDGVIHRVLVP